jgi:hypothetical protein
VTGLGSKKYNAEKYDKLSDPGGTGYGDGDVPTL